MNETTTIEKVTMAASGLLIFVGLFVMGVLEVLIGNPSPVPVTNDNGVVTAATTFPVDLRVGLIALGFVLLALYAIFRALAPRDAVEESGQRDPSTTH